MADKKKEQVIEEGADEVEVITLENDEGEQMEFVVIATIEHDGESYVFLEEKEEAEGDSEEGEVTIFKIGNEDGEEIFLPIEDEKLADTVFKKFLDAMDAEDANE